MLRCDRYNPSTGAHDRLSPDEVPGALGDPESLVWVDVQHPTGEEIAWLQRTFQFHPLALEDALDERQRPKMEHYEHYDFFNAHLIRFVEETHQLDTFQLGLFIGDCYVVSVHAVHLHALDLARTRWEQGKPVGRASTFLFYLILDVVVDEYFPIVDMMGDVIDDIDAKVFANPTSTQLQAIFRLRRSLLQLRKLLGPLRDALNELTRAETDGPTDLGSHTRAYFLDVFDHVLRLTDFVDTYRDMLSGSLDAYQSSLANRLNHNMQNLTVAATVLATGTVITGFYGMNLLGLGVQSSWPYSGEVVLAVLVLVTAIEIWLFRRAGWL